MRQQNVMRRNWAIVVVTALVATVTWIAPAQAGTFDDVPEGVWYEAPVEWLVSAGITNGTSDTTFSPGANVTRAQMAAFLARFGQYVADSPGAGFTDVPDGAFYDAPVDWLVEHAITTGTSATTYSPGANVTRAQMAAFLWRFAGRPPAAGGTPFVDVPGGQWYSEAVAWLVENDITQGTSDTTFSPDANVTRAQMAAFLWRLAGRPDVGQPGENRVASLPISSSGGVFGEGEVLVTIDGLTDDGFVKVVIGEGGAALASLDGAVSDDVEISVSQAELDGPITVTVPIETVDLDAVELVVYVLDGDGVWQPLAIDVTTKVVDGQMFATFTLPAGVSLAPSGWSLFAADDFERIVARVAATGVASPTTSSTSTSTTSTTTSTTVPAGPVLDVADIGGDQWLGVNEGAYVTASGGSGTYVEFRAEGLPPGMSIFTQNLGPFQAGWVAGTPTELGAFYATIEVEDSEGAIGTTIVRFDVLAGTEAEGTFLRIPGQRFTVQSYPMVSPDGAAIAFREGFFNRFTVLDVATGAETTVNERFAGPTANGSLSIDGAYYTGFDFDELFQVEVATGAKTVIAGGPYPSDQVQDSASSADGRFVVYEVYKIQPGAGPFDFTYLPPRLEVWDRATGSVSIVIESEAGDGGFDDVRMSRDGRYVSYRAGIDPFGTSSGDEGFVTDLLAATTAQITAFSGPTQWSDLVVSEDGSTAYFEVADELHVWTRSSGVVEALGFDLSSFGFSNPTATKVSEDGRYVAFVTRTSLVPGDTNIENDVYAWDRDTETLTRVTGASGTIRQWDLFDMTTDGMTVAIVSPDDLVADNDLNSSSPSTAYDLFLWSRADGSYERVTNGPPWSGGNTVLMSDRGETVSFFRTGLEIWDRSAQLSVEPVAVCPSTGGDALRAHMVVTLWRDAGQPTPTWPGSVYFDDVPAGAPYDEAVGWALEQGITVGTSPTTFSPEAMLTRSQYVVFLHRAAGTPTPGGPNPWADVPGGSFYENAAIWAADQGLAGTGPNTLGPAAPMSHDAAEDWWSTLDPAFDYGDCTVYE